MFGVIKTVRDEAQKRAGSDKLSMEDITSVVDGITFIDETIFAPYDVPETNPFLGRFTKWSTAPGVYRAHRIIVEIAYAKHLSEPWVRFVVCKELSHALLTLGRENGHEVSEAAIRGLADAFALQSARGTVANFHGLAYAEEQLAEAAATELLFPLQVRESELNKNPAAKEDQDVVMRLSNEYNLPDLYVCLGLDVRYNEVARNLLGD